MLTKLKENPSIILLVLLVAFFCVVADGFASVGNFFNLLRQVAVLGIVSAGMAVVILTGEIDLSVGSLVSLACCLVSILITKYGVPVLGACLIGVLVCMAATMLNCLIIEGTGIPSMLCTLATMQIFSGLAYIATGGMPVYGLPESMRTLGQGYIWKVPVPVIVMAVVFLLGSFFMSNTYPGRHIYAVGNNAETSALSGISVFKTKMLAFALCGALVGLAALTQTSRLFGGFPTAGTGMEMEAVTAVVVGGVSFAGGKGKLSGVVLGVLLMGVLSNGLGVMGTSLYTQMVFKGIVLVLVVGADCLRAKRARS